MDLANIVCVCKQKFNKKEFKKHHKNCKIFKQKFYDFDLRIAYLLKKFLLVKENASIIKFLFQRYIKLLEHKFKIKEVAKINVNNNINEINQNKEMQKQNLYQELYGNDNEIEDDFSNRLSFKGMEQNNNNNNINDLYKQNNNININGKGVLPNNQLNNNYMNKSAPFQINNLYNMQYQQYNNFGLDINKSVSFNIPNNNSIEQGYNCNNDIYSVIQKNNNNNFAGNQKHFNLNYWKIGSEIGEKERTVIFNICQHEYNRYKGKFTIMAETIVKDLNTIYSRYKWFILISNSEYNNNINYYLSEFIPERFMIFPFDKVIFHIKEYK